MKLSLTLQPPHTEIRTKAEKLFRERVLWFIWEVIPDLSEKILNLQIKILELDWYWENAETLDETVIRWFWAEIITCIEEIFRPNAVNTDVLLADMQEFLEWEKWLRDWVTPEKREIRRYYKIKSCDVRLMREIILLVKKLENSSEYEEGDILWEILDDLEDISEDFHNPRNGNRFCFQWKAIWKNETLQEYREYVTSVAKTEGNTKIIEQISTILNSIEVSWIDVEKL